jgi:hypothetical protein
MDGIEANLAQLEGHPREILFAMFGFLEGKNIRILRLLVECRREVAKGRDVMRDDP